jgi:hypothetical protein
MNIVNLFHSLYEKFVPTDPDQKAALYKKASTWYSLTKEEYESICNKNLLAEKDNRENEGKEGYKPIPPIPISFKYKFIMALDQWWWAYIFGIIYVWAVPAITRFINSADDDGEDDDDSNEELIRALLASRKK